MAQPLGANFLLQQGSGQQFEIMRQCNFHVDIEGLDIVLAAQSVNLPRYELEAVELFHYNDRVKVASKPNASDMSIQLVDYVAPNVVQQIWEWFKQVYNPNTSAMGLAGDYKRQGKVFEYAPDQTLVRTWTCHGIWPKNAPTPENARVYADGHEFVRIGLNLSVDRATLDASGSTGLFG